MFHLNIPEEKREVKLLSRGDVLDYFGISKSTLYRWVMKENKLPFIQINRRKFFKYSDIQNLIEENYSPNLSI
jgi:predicted DNA-binding transcriptional regulator AlpA|tara:strand:+ start:640 stop:858 length:219 start_codon:yes stop_codon:yes gene_type:complete